jgi:hypothetical protein
VCGGGSSRFGGVLGGGGAVVVVVVVVVATTVVVGVFVVVAAAAAAGTREASEFRIAANPSWATKGKGQDDKFRFVPFPTFFSFRSVPFPIQSQSQFNFLSPALTCNNKKGVNAAAKVYGEHRTRGERNPAN